ncbi:MAG: AGE family epimerase/isomerase [Fuerstiella sp.]
MKSKLSPERRNELMLAYEHKLLTDTIPFWTKHSVDHEFGGFITSVDRDGTIIDTDKGVWQQGRFTWLLSELYNNVSANEEWLQLAEHGIRFLDEHCFDPKDGRMWFQLNQSGKPIRKRRYSFSESFAAIAYGEYAMASGKDQYADKAEVAFRQFVDHNLSPRNVVPKFTDSRPTRGIGFPMITIATAQELRQSINFDKADEWIDRSIDAIRRFHIKEDLQCVMETVGPNGELLDCFDGRTLNPGHAIEGAWFIMAEGQHRNDTQLVQLGCQMLDWMWERGWDSEFRGLLYFVDLNNKPVQEYWHDMKFWWPQNEAIIATLLAYDLTGDEKYAHWHTQIHDWAHTLFPDAEHGEWFGYFHRDGRLSSSLKGNIWKGPFHIPRMQLVCSRILQQGFALPR